MEFAEDLDFDACTHCRVVKRQIPVGNALVNGIAIAGTGDVAEDVRSVKQGFAAEGTDGGVIEYKAAQFAGEAARFELLQRWFAQEIAFGELDGEAQAGFVR